MNHNKQDFILYKILFLFTLIFAQNNLYAQGDEKYFDPQPQNFMKQLGVLFKENQHDQLRTLYKKLESEFKQNKISDYQLGKMCDILNAMHKRKMNVYPMYKNFISATISATNSGFDEKFQDRWYLFVKGILDNSRRGQNQKFRTFIDFSNDLFEYNALVADKSKTYRIDTKDLSFEYQNGKFIVKVPTTNLKGYFRYDTTTIFNTSGEYNIMDKTWKGTGGMITWERVLFTREEVSASFGPYEIDMSKPSYTIDSVSLNYPEYFPKPVLGKLNDKITKEKDFTTVKYPQFITYDKTYSFDRKISPNISLNGGFMMKGNDIVISSEDGSPVIVEIYDLANTRKLIEAEGTSCAFKRGHFIRMDKSRIKIYLGNDSITHPFASIKYKVEDNSVTVLGEEYGSGKARYRSTFHNMAFDAEMLEWKIDQDHMDLSMLVGRGKNASRFISENNYDQETYNLARTASAGMNPLAVLSRLSKDGSHPIPLRTLVEAYGPSFSSSAVLPAVFSLEKDGFLSYRATDKTIMINAEKVKFYQKAYKKETDYDLVRFKGFGEKYIGKLHVGSKKIEVNSVHHVPFNDSSYVHAYPYASSKVEVSNNRKLKFGGKILAGRLDFYGDSYKFNYDSFSIKSDSITKMKINIPAKKDKTTGEEILKPLKSSLEKLKGEILINGKFNKSGFQSARMYPKFRSKDFSYIYYDNPNIYGGAYHRDDFFFKVLPFEKDSLLHFDPDNLYYDGELNSADIFEPFDETVRIQKDLSLGFTTQTSGDGYKNYGGKGMFSGSINLSNKGLIGKGDLNYMTTTLSSDSILYFPKKTNLIAKHVEMKEQKGGIEYPQMTADSVLAEWRPYSDTMFMASSKRNPFDMFNKVTRMHGLLVLKNDGLTGNGFLDFDEAKISSKDMRFKSTTMSADTSSMEIKSLGNKVTFKTPNVSCFMNFETKIGDFKSNAKDISTDFAYNQYKGEINEFRWDINKKILTFRAKEGSQGARFTSTHPLQDSLYMFCKTAEYNMISSIIKMDGVEEILIADSKVIPDLGKVNIFPEAKIETLKNASIEGDTVNNYHVIENATLNILGKNEISGTGNYNLLVNNQTYPINLHTIRVDKQALPLKRRAKIQEYKHTIEGIGKVQRDQKLKIYRNTDFYGDVHIFLNKKFPHFEGKQRIAFTNPSYKSPWFEVDNEINVAELSMYKKQLVADNGSDLHTGFFIDRETNTGLYTNLLAPLKSEFDNTVLDGRGVIKHLPLDNHYLFGDSSRILAGEAKGTKIDYNELEGTIVAEGKMDPSLKMGGIPFIMSGVMENDLNANTYKFNGAAGLNIIIDRGIMETITNFLIEGFEINKDIRYVDKSNRYALNELCHSKDYLNFYADIEKSGYIQSNPKYTPFNVILTDLVMDYDKRDVTFRSKPTFGVSIFGNVPINKITQGYLEIGYGEIFDYFNFYIKAKNREWLYMSYSDGQLEILTSNEFVNGTINQLDSRKRTIRKSSNEYYVYSQAGTYSVQSFVKRMQKGGKYADDERRIETNPDRDMPSKKQLEKIEIMDDKPEGLKVLEEEEMKKLTAEEEEIRALQAELKALEEQREALKKEEAKKGIQLEEFSTDNPMAPDLNAKPEKESEPIKEEELDESPESEEESEKESELSNPRESVEESPEDKKQSEPEELDAGQSLFDSMF